MASKASKRMTFSAMNQMRASLSSDEEDALAPIPCKPKPIPVLLIAGVMEPNDNSRGAAGRKTHEGRIVRASLGAHLPGVSCDLADMTVFFSHYTEAFEVHDTIQHTTRLEVKTVIEETYRFLKKFDDERTVAIYYTGHGCRSGHGEWCFADGSFSFKHLAALFRDRGNIMIFADSCFSGDWAESLKALTGKTKNVHIYAGSVPGKYAMDSAEKLGGAASIAWRRLFRELIKAGLTSREFQNIDAVLEKAKTRKKPITWTRAEIKQFYTANNVSRQMPLKDKAEILQSEFPDGKFQSVSITDLVQMLQMMSIRITRSEFEYHYTAKGKAFGCAAYIDNTGQYHFHEFRDADAENCEKRDRKVREEEKDANPHGYSAAPPTPLMLGLDMNQFRKTHEGEVKDEVEDEVEKVLLPACPSHPHLPLGSFRTTSYLNKVRGYNDVPVECADCHKSAQAVGGVARCRHRSADGRCCIYALCPECYFKRCSLELSGRRWNKPENQKCAPTCPAGHKLFNLSLVELHLHSGYPMEYATFICDSCYETPIQRMEREQNELKSAAAVLSKDFVRLTQKSKRRNTHAFHCPLCRYDLCFACFRMAQDKAQREAQLDYLMKKND